MEPTTPIGKYFRRMKETRLRGLRRLNIRTVRDMLYHFPSRYITATEAEDAVLEGGMTATLTGTVESMGKRMTRGKKRMMMTEASIVSNGRRVRAVWFHQPYIANQFAANDTVRISGKVAAGKKPYFANPIITKVAGHEVAVDGLFGGGGSAGGGDTKGAAVNSGVTGRGGSAGGGDSANAVGSAAGGDDSGGNGTNANPAALPDDVPPTPDGTTQTPDGTPLPVYPETKGISSLWLSTHIRRILKDTAMLIEDPLPEHVREKLHLPEIRTAFRLIHRPARDGDHAAARKRFIFEKTFAMQITHRQARQAREGSAAYPMKLDTERTDAFIRDRFAFTPTGDQRKAIREIFADIQKNRPMARLLEGDVGSGKTAVAAAVIHGVVTADRDDGDAAPQVAYLAPTEILARQQFLTIGTLFKNVPVPVAFISRKECLLRDSARGTETDITKTELKKRIADGTVSVTVGTHAVIQKDVRFGRLALIIIDEQHRFGVAQRRSLFETGGERTPHLLSMTATPIPRTLALTIYGDLDISVMEEMPKERKTVETKLVRSGGKDAVYAHIREEVKKGHQAYILCPRIESDAETPLRSLEEEYGDLRKTVFPDLTIGMLHGRMKPKEKQEVMERFCANGIQVLVCTTVVEVGVNVPNATVIAVLHAERFGLAQLHQLRGRVIRSSHQPYCYAVTDSVNEVTLERLTFFEREYNGFKLAQHDLSLRGTGEINGLRQSGVPDLVVEGLRNNRLMSVTRQMAEEIVNTDPTLEHYPALRRYIEEEPSHRE